MNLCRQRKKVNLPEMSPIFLLKGRIGSTLTHFTTLYESLEETGRYSLVVVQVIWEGKRRRRKETS